MDIHIIVVEELEYDTTDMMVTRLTILILYLTVQCYDSCLREYGTYVVSQLRELIDFRLTRVGALISLATLRILRSPRLLRLPRVVYGVRSNLNYSLITGWI